jgi:hypothetical protein
MSETIAGCWILAAARGDEGSYRKLLQAMRLDLASGSRTIVPCNCQPRCPQPTDEQMEALDRRLQADIQALTAIKVQQADSA